MMVEFLENGTVPQIWFLNKEVTSALFAFYLKQRIPRQDYSLAS
jgi:hypothetical protein